MPTVRKSVASLRFGGDNLDPDEISDALGKKPTLGVRKGGVWVTPKGREIVASSGLWLIRTSEAVPGDIDQHIAALFEGLTEDFPKWQSLAERYDGNIFAGLFLGSSNEGLSLSAATLTAIGMRGLQLGLDIYAASDGESDTEAPADGPMG